MVKGGSAMPVQLGLIKPTGPSPLGSPSSLHPQQRRPLLQAAFLDSY